MGGEIMKENILSEVITQKKWSYLIANYNAQEICSSLSFSEAMHLAKSLCFDDFQNDENQQFALKLIFGIRNYFSNEWELDWKNDVFLGDMCDLLWLYDERYTCYKRAYDKLLDPPQALLLHLASCRSAPEPSISEKEYEFYVKKAIEKKVTAEAAIKMRTLCRFKGDKIQEEYWNQVYEQLEKDDVHTESIVPDVFKIHP